MANSIADYVIPAASEQYVRVPISATFNGSVIDPTTDVVQFAFPLPGVAPSTWVTGSWETDSGVYNARVLVGPGTAFALAVGYYQVLVKIVASPEIPVLNAGLLEVFP